MKSLFASLLVLTALSSAHAESNTFKVDKTMNYDAAGAKDEDDANKTYIDYYKSAAGGNIPNAINAGQAYAAALAKGKGGTTLDAQMNARATYLPNANSESPNPNAIGQCYKRTLLAGGTSQIDAVPCNGGSYQQTGSSYVGAQVLDNSKQEVAKDWRSDGPFPQNLAKTAPKN